MGSVARFALALSLLATAALPVEGQAARLEYAEDCQIATIEGTADIVAQDLASGPTSQDIELCATATADVRMEDGDLVRMDDVEIKFAVPPDGQLTIPLFKPDDTVEPSLTAILNLLGFAFLYQQSGESQGSPSGSQFPADFTAEGSVDFDFEGRLADDATKTVDSVLTLAFGEPLLPGSVFSEPDTIFIETTPDPVPSLLVPLFYSGPFNLFAIDMQISFLLQRSFVLAPLGPPLPDCDPAPRTDCITAGSAKLSVNEKKVGNEKLSLQLKKLEDPVTQAQLGSPVSGASAYEVCLYDAGGTLAGGVDLDRAGALCGKKDKPCWKDLSGQGFKYNDSLAEAGVTKLLAKAGDPGKGKITVAGRNKAKKGQAGLRAGLAGALAGAMQATAQLVVDDGTCFGAALTDVKKADGSQFKAKGP